MTTQPEAGICKICGEPADVHELVQGQRQGGEDWSAHVYSPTQPERGEQWRVSEHNGLWTEDIQAKAPEHSEFLEKVLRVVHNGGDEEYEEFAVGAADAVPLAKKLNALTTERDEAKQIAMHEATQAIANDNAYMAMKDERDAALTVVRELRELLADSQEYVELYDILGTGSSIDPQEQKEWDECKVNIPAALARADALLEGK